MAADTKPNSPKRVEGPTPNGGAYALAYERDDGSVEIVEFDSNGNQIFRTYMQQPAPEQPLSPPSAGFRL